jgi:hypothetical protein
VFNLGDHTLSTLSHVSIKVSGSFVELQIAKFISFPSFYERKFSKDRFLFDVLSVFEDFCRLGFGNLFRDKSFICPFVFDNISTSLNNSSDTSGRIEGWNPCPSAS